MTMSARIRAHCASGSRRARRAARLRGERARARILPEPAAAVRTGREHADARQVPPADDAGEVPDGGLSRERELHELVLGDPRGPRLDLAYEEAIGRWAAHGLVHDAPSGGPTRRGEEMRERRAGPFDWLVCGSCRARAKLARRPRADLWRLAEDLMSKVRASCRRQSLERRLAGAKARRLPSMRGPGFHAE